MQDALRGCGLARDLYPASPDADPAWLYAEWTPASLALEEGLSYAALAAAHPGHGYSGQAAAIFARAAGGQQPVPDRIRYEAIARQAAVTVLDGDLDGYEELAAAGLAGAVMLGSTQRYRELRAAWQQASARWPGSRRVAAAGDALRESSAACGPA